MKTHKVIIKERNAEFITDTIIPTLVSWEGLLSIGQLMVFFHAGNSIGLVWGENSDKAETRNHNYLKALAPSFTDSYIQAFISGSFKPTQFIHPFESYHTTEGSQDPIILAEFIKTTDYLTREFFDLNIKGEEFLAFVYMYFLVIHPFVDGNGRVARNLLDYYNTKLEIKIQPSWNNADPKFSSEKFHKDAFEKLYSKDFNLSPCNISNKYCYKDVADIQITRAHELSKMKERMLYFLTSARKSATIPSEAIQEMAKGIICNATD